MITNDFYLLTNLGFLLHLELHRTYYERVAGLNREKLGAYKPGQYQPSEKDFKPGFKEETRFFFETKVRVILIIRLSIATQLSTNLLFA